MVGIFFLAIFHQRLVLTESEVLHLEMFLLGKKKRKENILFFRMEIQNSRSLLIHVTLETDSDD